MRKTVVVTGASGFLGRAVVRVLAGKEVEVVPVSRRRVPGRIQVNDYRETPTGDVLVHLAEERDRSGANASGEAYRQAAQANLAALLAKGWQQVVYASSAVLYGDRNPAACRVGDSIQVSDTYTVVKRAGEEAVLAWGGMVARLTNLYGPGMAVNNVVSTILRQVRIDGPIRIWDDGPVRDFLWVTDAAELIAAMATDNQYLGECRGVYNVGTGVGTSVGELARLAQDIAGTPRRPVVATNPQDRSSCLILDIDDTVATWGWRPRVGLRQGIAELLKNCNQG